MKINEQIRMARIALGLSESELAAKIGVSRTSIIHWEMGPEHGGNGVARRNRADLEAALEIKLVEEYEGMVPPGALSIPGVREADLTLAQNIGKLPKVLRDVVESLVTVMIERVGNVGVTLHTSGRKLIEHPLPTLHTKGKSRATDTQRNTVVKPQKHQSGTGRKG